MKNVVGVPLRFGAFIVISGMVLDAALSKAAALIFGKSYDSMKHEENEDNRKEQKAFLKEDLNRRLYEVAAKNQANMVQQGKAYNNQQNLMATRGKTQYSNEIPQVEKVDNYTYIPSSKNVIPKPKENGVDNYTHIPSSNNKISEQKGTDLKRSYIPSQDSKVQKTFDNSGLQSALDRAQRAEDKALRVLAGNFDGM